MKSEQIMRSLRLIASLFARSWHRHPRLWCTVVATLAIALAYVPVQTPDWNRFNDQAESIASGNGFRTRGHLEASLPPGYPVFVALLKVLAVPEGFIPFVHIALFLCACNLVYLSLRPWSERLAAFAMLGLAVQPLAVRMVGYYLSETWGLFLCALLFFVWAGAARGAREPWRFICLGVLLVVLPLTSPATILMCFFMGAYAFTRVASKRAPGLAAALAAGALVVMVPWQAQCVRASGSICPLLMPTATTSRLFGSRGSAEVTQDGFFAWFRTWSTGEADLPSAFAIDPGVAPARAFESAAERSALLALGPAGGGSITEAQLGALAALAQARRHAHPLTQYVVLPLQRSYRLWLEMIQIGHAQQAYVGRVSPMDFAADLRDLGPGNAGARWLKGALSTLVYALYVAPPLLALAALRQAIKRRNWFGLLLLLSIGAYTLIAGYSALGEARRNVVFFPAILYLLSLWSPREDIEPQARGTPAQETVR